MQPIILFVRITILPLMLLFLQGCHSVESNEMIGVYKLRANWGCGTLTLRSDHSFRQEVTDGCSGQAKVLKGSWSWDNASVSKVTFKPFLDHESEGFLKQYEYDDLPVEQPPLSPIRIVVNPDAGFSYDKQN